MASQMPQDPLDVLQLMVNDVLVQTGKALRSSRKDGQGNVAQAHGSLQSKLPDTIRTFHSALDDLEHDIIRAKSVLLRDLTQIQEQKQQRHSQEQPPPEQIQHHQNQRQPIPTPQQPQPIESQSKEPMVIDLDSSPPPNDQVMIETKATKPVAPFPDMGMGLPDMTEADMVIKDVAHPIIPPTSLPETTSIKHEHTASPVPMAPMPEMDEKPVDMNMDISGGDLPNPELNFTNMEFTLAPTNNDSQNPPTSQESSFDLATFAPAEGGDSLMGLDNLLPSNHNEQANINTVPKAPVSESPIKAENQGNPNMSLDLMHLNGSGPQENTSAKKEEMMDSTFDELMFMDSGHEYGSGGGLGEETFEDMMDNRDETFDMMQHGDFDNSFFGLDNAEET
ncbi:hypothetical protein AK830_g330 [Neonectria ditissima]|uniref:Uncharacterized protein n=1 Tax=Neonectria ditissima TaxID=78410 RepID=A0A0N8H924_9HYPO|nr:hypothetical protein AK830_g330 [Neonectria ditissima]